MKTRIALSSKAYSRERWTGWPIGIFSIAGLELAGGQAQNSGDGSRIKQESINAIVMFPAWLGSPIVPAGSFHLLQTPGHTPSAARRQRALPAGRPGS